MKLETYLYNCPTEVLKEIEELVKNSNLDERFCWEANCWFVGRNEKALIGLVSYIFIIATDGNKYPRFLHIIINEPYKRTKQALNMLKNSEEELRKLGHKKIIAEIERTLPNRDMKIKYALKFGYKKYAENDKSEYFFKQIGG